MRTAVIIVLLTAILLVVGMTLWPLLAHSEDNGTLLWRGTLATSRVFDSRNGGQFFNCYPTLWDEVFNGKHVLVRNRAECPEPYKYMSDIGMASDLFAHDGGATHMHKDKRGWIVLTP